MEYELKEKIRETVIGGLVWLVLGTAVIGPCVPAKTKTTTRTQPIEQVFLNHNGYTTTHTEGNGQIITTEFGGYRTAVYRDLKPGEKGYANISSIEDSNIIGCGLRYYDITEIHIANNMELTPGYDSYGKPNQRRHYQMQEIQ